MGSPSSQVGASNNVSVFVKLYTICAALATIPPTLLMVALSHGFQQDHLSLKERIKRASIRSILCIVPLPLLRKPDPSRIDKILDSPRFSSVRDQLVKPVRRSDFSGYWICQGSIAKSAEPRRSDVTIIFCHGGGYVTGDLPMYLAFLLRMAESVEEQGLTVSIFMLEYSLAPESPFPTQLEQMAAAYRYITENEGVSPSKIALAGDSAGGNLLLSFLASLHSPLTPSSPRLTEQFPGLFLVSPWVSFLHSAPSFRSNEARDILRKSSLDYWASCLQSGSKLDPGTIESYTEFGREDRNRPSLKMILPSRVWITAGGDELMVSDISSFAERARKDGIQVSFSITPGRAHCWQLSESGDGETAYLQIPRSDSASAHLPGVASLGRMIAKCMQAT